MLSLKDTLYLKSHQSSHLWSQERHWMGEVRSQWIVNRAGEANHWWRHLRQVGQRHGCALAIQHGNSYDPLGGILEGGAAGLHVCSDLPLPLVPAILKPDLHLRLCELQRGRQAGALRAAQVALQVKSGLQLEDLTPAEHSAGLLLSSYFQVA